MRAGRFAWGRGSWHEDVLDCRSIEREEGEDRLRREKKRKWGNFRAFSVFSKMGCRLK